MSPKQEQEMIDALKSIAASLEQLNRYVMVVTHQKLGIAPIIVQNQAARHQPPR
jgi:hypothetical protein